PGLRGCTFGLESLLVVVRVLRFTWRRLLRAWTPGFWSAGESGDRAEPLTMVMSPPRPGASCTDLNVCLGKLIQASSMPGPVLGRSAFCGPLTGAYAGSRLAVLVVAAPLAGGAAPGPLVVLGAGLLHAASTPTTARPPTDRKNALRLLLTGRSLTHEGGADTYGDTYASVAAASSSRAGIRPDGGPFTTSAALAASRFSARRDPCPARASRAALPRRCAASAATSGRTGESRST